MKSFTIYNKIVRAFLHERIYARHTIVLYRKLLY